MTRKCLVRFLGGWEAVTPPGYPDVLRTWFVSRGRGLTPGGPLVDGCRIYRHKAILRIAGRTLTDRMFFGHGAGCSCP